MNGNFYIMARGFPIFLLVFFPRIIDSSVEMFTTVASRSCSVPLVGGRLMMMMMESSRSHRTLLQKSGEVNGIAKGVPIHTLTLFLFVVSFLQIPVCTRTCVSTWWIHHELWEVVSAVSSQSAAISQNSSKDSGLKVL